ncbi:triacylglycerol lipase [Corynebacterium stationis]|uniref:Triacylglycerol lipase n=2 Tax=Corynebacterium stationis TaxID=1705 RepID=A0AB36CMS2_9CORY|nr:triacylglycerol lipase [Corynebacterium stationis]
MEQAGSGSTVSSLPLGARLKPRGIFEDDWTATLSARRPWPVILLHGTCDSKGIWQLLGADLREDGWAVFAPDYGTRATGLIPDSAAQVGAYIQAVMHTTGAKKVIIMGHSQGGLVARYWMRLLGGAKYVKHLVCIGTPNHGTTQGGILSPLVTNRRADSVMQSVIDAYFGPAGAQQIVGSDILDEVNRDGDLEEGVTYTNIVTRSDAVVVPPESCFLAPDKVKDGTVRNIYVQDFDRRAVVLHHDLPVDKRVRVIARTILRQIGPM